MKSKPKGQKYRNLFARCGVIYYESEAGGERVKRTMATDDWNEAATARDVYLQGRAAKLAGGRGEALRFADLAERYLREATRHLAGSTREDRERMLGANDEVAAWPAVAWERLQHAHGEIESLRAELRLGPLSQGEPRRGRE